MKRAYFGVIVVAFVIVIAMLGVISRFTDLLVNPVAYLMDNYPLITGLFFGISLTLLTGFTFKLYSKSEDK